MSDLVVGLLVLALCYLAWIVLGYKLDEREQKLH